MTPPILRGTSTGKLHKLAFELRYQFGHTYLDRCGRTINAIQRTAPEWLTTDAGLQGTALLSIRNASVFAFSSASLNLVLEQPIDAEIKAESIEAFQEQVGLLSAIVIDELGLDEFTRIGLRSVFAYPTNDKADTERWMSSLKWFNLSDSLREAFGQTVESTGFSAVMTGEDRHYRVAVNGVEKPPQVEGGASPVQVRTSTLSEGQNKAYKAQLLQKHKRLTEASYAVSIDIDAYQENPFAPDVADFVRTSREQTSSRLHTLAKNI